MESNQNSSQLIKFLDVVNQASQIGENSFNNPESKATLAKEKIKIENLLKVDAYIKVPVVGDFSSGKSSLVNAFIGRELLPTNITPETAVCYELYYADRERIEVWHEGSFVKTGDLSLIGHVAAAPGDVVKVYLTDDKIKKLNDKGIALVDMPGIDSGIEAHNNSIMNYISSGTSFIICVDAEQGTLRRSAIDFIQEIKKYQLSASVIITKIDKKPESEIQAIVDHVKSQAKQYIGDNAMVVTTSAHRDDVAGLDQILASLDGDAMIKHKYGAAVQIFVTSVAKELDVQIAFMLSDKGNFDAEIQKMNEEKKALIEKVNDFKNNTKATDESVNRIVDSAEQALFANIDAIARNIQQSRGDQTRIKEQILSIVRPALVNSFKNEISAYAEELKDVLVQYEDQIEGILENGIQKAPFKFELAIDENDKSTEAILSTILGVISQMDKNLHPILKVLITFLPQILNWLFGKSSEEILEQIKGELGTSFLGQIKDSIKPGIKESFTNVKYQMTDDLERTVNAEIKSIEDTIQSIQEKGALDAAEKEAKAKELKDAIETLEKLSA